MCYKDIVKWPAPNEIAPCFSNPMVDHIRGEATVGSADRYDWAVDIREPAFLTKADETTLNRDCFRSGIHRAHNYEIQVATRPHAPTTKGTTSQNAQSV